jgi:hypothetical protein
MQLSDILAALVLNGVAPGAFLRVAIPLPELSEFVVDVGTDYR